MSRTNVTSYTLGSARRRNAGQQMVGQGQATHQEEDDRTERELWYAAVKPPMYTVAVMPVIMGSAVAFAERGQIDWGKMVSFLACTVLVIAWVNLTNDVFDFDTGVDVNKKESVVNLCGATREARNAILALSTVILGMSGFVLWKLGDDVVWLLMGIAVCGGYLYQGPPFRLGYYGLGEPITFVAWSIGVCCSYYIQVADEWQGGLAARLAQLWRRVWSSETYLLAGMFLDAVPTTWILFCSHFHQAVDDLAVGKRSPIVRLGTKKAAAVLDLCVLLFWSAHVVLRAIQMLPGFAFYLSLLAIPKAAQLTYFVREFHDIPEVIRLSKYRAVKFHILHGSLASLGFFLTGYRRASAT